MLLSFNWLKQYVNLPDSITPEEVAEKLKLSTVEVEQVINSGALLENVVVGKILKCEKHSNADKLKVCTVDVGNEKLTIVCGGSNVAEGMFVAVAKVGAKVKWHGEGELVELKPTKIRGVESFGMICASEEIGLGDVYPKRDEKEILDLSDLSPALPLKGERDGEPPFFQGGGRGRSIIGQPLADVLGLSDAILEIDNKSLSNRPDLWGHYGMAREIAVLFNREVKAYETKEIKEGSEIKVKVDVEDAKLCPKYMAVAMSGIKVADSPEWLKTKLIAVGLRPINNIVDITNYVMLDIGQPLHAFDKSRLANLKSKIENLKLIVRRAVEGEKFTTLDGVERNLTSEMLVIANAEKAIALAGVMGGMESGISNDTTTIVFEAANFDAVNIRKTSTKLALRTDSSARFEKSLDPNLCEVALRRAVELVQECCSGAIAASKVVGEGKPRLFTGPLEIANDFFAKKLGVDIPAKTIVSILSRLGFGVEEKKKFISVKIPSWRATKDISIAEDVAEEVARIYGYDNIPPRMPNFNITPPIQNPLRKLERTVVDVLVKELAYTEVYNYSFVSETQINFLGDDANKYLALDNPLSKEKPYLRRCLLPNLLENVRQNIENYSEVKIFEIGKAFRGDEAGQRALASGDELLPRQDTWFTAVYCGKKDGAPFWEARRVFESLAESMGAGLSLKPQASPRPWVHPGRAAAIFLGEAVVGKVYELNPQTANAFGIEGRVGVASINLSALSETAEKFEIKKYHPLALYPQMERDIAFIVNKKITHQEISDAILKTDPLLTKAELFDVYEGKNVGEGYKSMAYRLAYKSDHTLKSEEVDAVEEKIKKLLKEKFNAEAR